MHPPPSLEGVEIAVTGRLASMTRDDAVRAIEERGGRYVEIPSVTTDLLVVGSEGWPLQRDGRLTRALHHARELEQMGCEIRIVDEFEFLIEADLPEQQAGLRRLYTTEQLARILELPIARLRSFVRRGLVRPARVVRRLCYFDFTQVARARALVGLLEQGVTVQDIRRSIGRLERWLPDAASNALSQLALIERGRRLVVRLDDGSLVEPSGQLRFGFADDTIAAEAAALARPPALPVPPRRTGPQDAQDWFAVGLAAEDEGDLERAAEAYHLAQLANGPQPEISFNLGNALHGLDRIAEAAQRYAVAVELDPEYVEAWNNLGNALGELGRYDDAVAAYQRALALEPRYADAHFNLAETLQQLERFEDAERHWRAYLAESPHASDRAYVERMLRECTVRSQA